MISVEFGVTVSMFALVATPGTPKGLQFRGGDLNRSTQHLLILLDKEVADGDVTDIVHGEAEG